MKSLLAALALALASCVPSGPPVRSAAAELQLTGRVVDSADLLDEKTEQALTARLVALEKKSTDRFVVVTVSTLHGQPMKRFATDLANRWGIGRADVDNGVLLVVAPNEKQVRIAVGHGLEGLLTDDSAAAIIQKMLPVFRQGHAQDAILIGVRDVENVLVSDLRRPQRKQAQARKVA